MFLTYVSCLTVIIAVFHIPLVQKVLSAKFSEWPQTAEMMLMKNTLSIILKHSLITCLISQNLSSEMSLGPLHTSIKSIHTRVGYVNEITDPSFWPLLQERSFEAISFVCMKVGSHEHGDTRQCSPTD